MNTSDAKSDSLGPDCCRILHLADLHFSGATNPATKLELLIGGLNERLSIDRLDFVVVSGDFTEKGKAEGFSPALKFLSGISERYQVSHDRFLLVPGNHDLQEEDEIPAYFKDRWSEIPSGRWFEEAGKRRLTKEEAFQRRFQAFSEKLYEQFLGMPYPQEIEKQWHVKTFSNEKIQFLLLNSAWDIDKDRRKNSSIHPDALQSLNGRADHDLGDSKLNEYLRIGIWHHAVKGEESMKNSKWISSALQRNWRIGLHGDVHEQRDEPHFDRKSGRKIDILGVGSFASSSAGRSESTPCLLSLLEISADRSVIRVHHRQQKSADEAWMPIAEWPDPLTDGATYCPFFDIHLNNSSPRGPRLHDASRLITVQEEMNSSNAPIGPQSNREEKAEVSGEVDSVFGKQAGGTANKQTTLRQIYKEIVKEIEDKINSNVRLGDALVADLPSLFERRDSRFHMCAADLFEPIDIREVFRSMNTLLKEHEAESKIRVLESDSLCDLLYVIGRIVPLGVNVDWVVSNREKFTKGAIGVPFFEVSPNFPSGEALIQANLLEIVVQALVDRSCNLENLFSNACSRFHEMLGEAFFGTMLGDAAEEVRIELILFLDRKRKHNRDELRSDSNLRMQLFQHAMEVFAYAREDEKSPYVVHTKTELGWAKVMKETLFLEDVVVTCEDGPLLKLGTKIIKDPIRAMLFLSSIREIIRARIKS